LLLLEGGCTSPFMVIERDKSRIFASVCHVRRQRRPS
jgi:hypothetical protein